MNFVLDSSLQQPDVSSFHIPDLTKPYKMYLPSRDHNHCPQRVGDTTKCINEPIYISLIFLLHSSYEK